MSDRSTPIEVNAGYWQQLAVGYDTACGIPIDGSLWCWGERPGGGQRTVSQPTRIGEETWLQVEVSQRDQFDELRQVWSGHACAVRSDNTLWCWGKGSRGQLGQPGDYRTYYVPMQVEGDDWASVSAGATHSCAIRIDDSLWCWGSGSFGELGVGELVDILDGPTQIGTDGWKQVSAGTYHTCGVQLDDSLWCWGANQYDRTLLGDPRLGDLDTLIGEQPAPARIGDAEWLEVSVGHEHTCGIQADLTLWCWGRNTAGELGLGDESLERGFAQWPSLVVYEPWKTVSVGLRHTCGIKFDGTMWCWGDNARGELGDGGGSASLEPLQVGQSDLWYDIDLGGRRSYGLLQDQNEGGGDSDSDSGSDSGR